MARDEAYREAEEKIREVHRSGAKELHLSRMGLTELPESLGQLTQLQSLNLRGNQLTALPESLGQVTQLQSLNLRGNQLTALPESLGQLTQLQSLDLSSNHKMSLPESLGQLAQLQSLNLFGNRLTALPEWLGQLTQLQSLDLSHNQLTTLPMWLSRLAMLRDLSVWGNQFSELPESIRGLRQIARLSVSRTRLESFPPWIGTLRHLRELYAIGNRIERLPEEIASLSELQRLVLGGAHLSKGWKASPPLGNRLVALPESIGQLTQLRSLELAKNQLRSLPESLGCLTQLQSLDLQGNQLTALPESLGQLTQLQNLDVSFNELATLPESIGCLTLLRIANLYGNNFDALPSSISRIDNLHSIHLGMRGEPKGDFFSELPSCLRSLKQLRNIQFWGRLRSLPEWMLELRKLATLDIDSDLLDPELSAAYKEGLDAVKRYLRAKAEAQVMLNEAKLILIGEGGVGKSSLLGALRGDAWQEKRDTTHGVETKVVKLVHPDNGKEITLNGWDFGGQPLYRPTHQLFFTAPAVYLAVWEPRRGPKQSCVDEWIKMAKHRTYDDQHPEHRPRVLVVATYGGPKERRDHIDEESLRRQFGDMIVGFHHVDSLTGYGLDELKNAIARTADSLPCVGRSVPASWKRILDGVRKRSEGGPYITYTQYEALCEEQQVTGGLVGMYAAMLNELGHLIHYSTDPTLRDTVILKADWLSKAISFVLEDKEVKDQAGLVDHEKLAELWNDRARAEAERYPPDIHPVFLRLMERFELSYRVALPERGVTAETSVGTRVLTVDPGTSLISQLVPGARPPELAEDWPQEPAPGDSERVQVCRIVDAINGQPASAEGLLYRLIVRLHRYSLGRTDYRQSRHWQRGLVVDDAYNGRALLEEIGGDIRVTVRAAYPERLLHHLCEEVKWLVDNFWKGLDCLITVPCLPPCQGTLEIAALIEARRDKRPEYPCPVCRKWLSIDSLLTTAPPMPDAQIALAELKRGQAKIIAAVEDNYQSLSSQLRMLMSQADDQFARLMKTLTDEAKEGPRLFSFVPVKPGFFDRPKWISEKFRLTLWCEHSRLPLPQVDSKAGNRGVYEIDLTREWVKKAAPFLKVLTGTLSLVLPVASSAVKLAMDETAYKAIEDELDFGKECIDATLEGSEKIGEWLGSGESADLEHGEAIRAEGGVLRELHAILKKKDPTFGGLVRVQNKRQEFLWVHPQFAGEY